MSFFYDLDNSKKKLQIQAKKIFFIRNFVSNLHLQFDRENIFFHLTYVTNYESSN